MDASNYTPVPLMTQPGVTLLAQPAVAKRERKSYKRTLYWLGFIEVILGVSSCLLGIIGIVIVSSRNGLMLIASSGVWCGMFLIFSGGLACKIKHQSATSFVKGSMGASVVTSIFMCVMLVMSIMGLATHRLVIMSALFILLCVISIAGLILAIVHVVFCCATVCCVQRHSHRQVLYTPVAATQQLIHLPSGQYMLVHGQHVVPPPYEAHADLVPTTSAAPQVLRCAVSQPKPESDNPPPPYSPQVQQLE